MQAILTALSLRELVRPDLSQAARRRLFAQSAVRIDGCSVTDPQASLRLEDGIIVRSGKRSWARIRLNSES